MEIDYCSVWLDNISPITNIFIPEDYEIVHERAVETNGCKISQEGETWENFRIRKRTFVMLLHLLQRLSLRMEMARLLWYCQIENYILIQQYGRNSHISTANASVVYRRALYINIPNRATSFWKQSKPQTIHIEDQTFQFMCAIRSKYWDKYLCKITFCCKEDCKWVVLEWKKRCHRNIKPSVFEWERFLFVIFILQWEEGTYISIRVITSFLGLYEIVCL